MTAAVGETTGPGSGRTDGTDDAGRARRSWPGCLAGLVVLGLIGWGVTAFLDSVGMLPGSSMERRWTTPSEPQAHDYGNGDWLVDGTLVRSRYDAVTGYDARTGKRRWETVPPGRSQICEATVSKAEGILLITRGEGIGDYVDEPEDAEGKGCGTVAAIDLRTGEELWQAPRRVVTISTIVEPADSSVAAGHGLAVVRDSPRNDRVEIGDPRTAPRPIDPRKALRALDLRTGEARWTADMPKGCYTLRVTVGPRQVSAVLACAEGTGREKTVARLAAFDTATGDLAWTVPLGSRRPFTAAPTVDFVSADPILVYVQEYGEQAYSGVFSFDREGRQGPDIEDVFGIGKYLRTDAGTVLDGDRLYTAGGPGVVAADLRTGRVLWTAEIDDGTVVGLTLDDGELHVVSAMNRGRSSHEAHVLDAATGEETDDLVFGTDVDGDDTLDGLYAYDGRLITVRHSEEESVSTFTAWERD